MLPRAKNLIKGFRLKGGKMSRFNLMVRPFSWEQYSKRVHRAINDPLSNGILSLDAASKKNARFVRSHVRSADSAQIVQMDWYVDLEEGIVLDAKYQLIGHSALIGILEYLIPLVIGKNYDQARRISADLIEQNLKDKMGRTLPEECSSHINLILDLIDLLSAQCDDIPLSHTYVAPPVQSSVIDGNGYEGFKDLSLKQKIAVINQVLDEEVRGYIALDGGGVEVINLINDKEVLVAYQGACTSCFSATGATLSYIQQVIQAKVDPDLVVVPDLEGLTGSF